MSDGGIRIDNGSTAVLAGPTISANTIKRCLGDSGIRVGADSVSILGNSIDAVLGFNRGIDVIARPRHARGSIAKNKVTNGHDAGIRVAIGGVAVSENVVSKCGGGYNGSAGIHIALVDNCTLVGNKVTDIDGDGFHIEGNTNTLTDCSATKCVNDGFDLVSGNGNSLDGCVASSCFGEGLDNSNGVTGSIVKNSTFSKCRIDFAGNGTLAQDVNNTFTTGGAATAPVIDQP